MVKCHKGVSEMAYSSRIANEILCTPFDDKSSISSEISTKLTEIEFFEHCYCRPEFITNKTHESEDILNEIDNADMKLLLEDYQDQITRQRNEYHYFLAWMANFDNHKIYTISGNAGTGKTTLVNYLKYKNREMQWIILDVARSANPVRWFGDAKTNIKNFRTASGKLYGIMLSAIYERLFNRALSSGDKYSVSGACANLRTLVHNYKKNFDLSFPAGASFMEELEAIITREHEEKQCIKSVAEFCAEYFSNISVSGAEESSAELDDALDVLLLISRCVDGGFDKKHIIVFDNFERFINQDEIYNREVDAIRIRLSDYLKGVNDASPHKGAFKFLMAIRTSTARMYGVRLQASDALANNLNIGQWYDSDEIIEKKTAWYKLNNISIDNSELVEQIVGDYRQCADGTITGLKLQIDPLFNHNKRLIIDFIGSVVELPSYQTAIKKYQALWAENVALSRFAARSIIRGLMLDYLEKEDNLFMHLGTYSRGSSQIGIGDARRILTILYNEQNSYENHVMPLTSVLCKLYNRTDIQAVWTSGEAEMRKKRKTVSEILFYMNSYNRRDNDWIQFLDIQIFEPHSDGRAKNKADVLVENPGKLDALITERMDDITLHIMPAGVGYLTYIVPTFEFFSMRYSNNYSPLFSMVPTPEEMKKTSDIKSLPCFKTLKRTVECAMKCLHMLQHEGDIPLIINRTEDTRQYHANRIQIQHTNYIGAFMGYIRMRYILYEGQNIDGKTRKKYEMLLEEIAELRKKYNLRL